MRVARPISVSMVLLGVWALRLRLNIATPARTGGGCAACADRASRGLDGPAEGLARRRAGTSRSPHFDADAAGHEALGQHDLLIEVLEVPERERQLRTAVGREPGEIVRYRTAAFRAFERHGDCAGDHIFRTC